MTANIRDFLGKNVHFIGAGGSSMNGLAALLKREGYNVTGSDKTRSHKTDALVEKGIPVFIGHDPKNIENADVLVYSAAISLENPERQAALAKGIPQIERCDLIGQLMQGSPCAIGISGTHGKTTTTSMMAQSFLEAGSDPTVHIGGELDFMGGSTRRGTGEFILEACEFNRSFLKFYPTVAVILNIDRDHLDCYKDIDDIENAFLEYARLVPEDTGCVVGWGDDFRVKRVLENSGRRFVTYGEGEENMLRPENLTYDEFGRASFNAVFEGEDLGFFRLNVASRPNMLDALAVIACAHLRGLDMQKIQKALGEFTGAHRRFELTSVSDGVRCYTDYGHNPAEIRTAIEIAMKQPHGHFFCVWQPHTYSRTKLLFDDFLDTFHGVGTLLITDICAAREKDPGDIRSDMFLEPLRARGINVVHTPTFDDAENYLRANWKAGDLMISHGCGDIDLLNEQIAAHDAEK